MALYPVITDADALGKKLNEEVERLESPNLGILSSSSITQSVISDRKSDHPKTNSNASKQDDLDPADGVDDRDDQDLVSIANSEDNSLVVSEPGEGLYSIKLYTILDSRQIKVALKS